MKALKFFLVCSVIAVDAQVYVTTGSDALSPPAGSLRAAILAATNGTEIVINSGITNITLAAPLPTIVQNNLTLVSANPTPITLSGNNAYQLFSVTGTNFAVRNINLINGLGLGGNGGDGGVLNSVNGGPGGGGLGAGGAMFINNGASVTLGASTLSGNQAIGGNGGVFSGIAAAGGGGGGAGSGDLGFNNNAGGAGATDLSLNLYHGGGGGGGNAGGVGGSGTTAPGTGGVAGGVFGGGGGGGQGIESGAVSASPGADAYYAAATLTFTGGSATSTLGGGGAGGGGNGNGAVAGVHGGQGGLGIPPNQYGGGGGGAGDSTGAGGIGVGFAGGGGAGSGDGGNSGLNGGGGGGSLSHTGGQGGYGGGEGCGQLPHSPPTVFFGGTASVTSGGGGGAGLGGAVFLFLGGTLTIEDDVVFSAGTNTVAPGTGGLGNAQAQAPDLFMRSGATVIFQNNANPMVINSNIWSNGDTIPPGGIVMQGTNTLVLGGNNNFTRSVTITSGTVQISSNPNLGNAANSVIIQNGTLSTTSSIPSARAFSLTGDATLSVSSSTTLTLSGVLSGNGSCTKASNGILLLQNANTYTGGTYITGGTFRLGTGGSLDSSGFVNVSSGATFDISTASGAQTIGDLSGAGAASLGSVDLTFGGSQNATFSGPITGSSQLIKAGSGSAFLTGNNSGYTGAATVQGGLLEIDGAFGGSVAVSGGTTLQGIGTIAGSVAVADSATIKPGHSPGTLSMNDLTLSSLSNTYIQLQPAQPTVPTSSSNFIVANAANVAGQLTVEAPIGAYPSSVSYTILTAGVSRTGMFTLPVVFTPGGQNMGPYQVLYSLSAPFTVILSFTAVPPPLITTTLPGNTNGQNLINYLNQFNASPPLEFVVFDLSMLSPSELNAAVNSISPARNAIGTFVGQNTMFSLAGVVSMRLVRQRLVLRDMRTNFGKERLASFTDLSSPALVAHKLSTEGSAGLLASPASNFWAASSAHVTDDTQEFLESLNEERKFSPRGNVHNEAKRHDREAWWLQGLGGWIYQEAGEENPAYNAQTGGGIIGYEYYGEENGLLGAAFSYAKSHVHQRGQSGSNDIQYYTLTLYGTVYRGDGYAELGIAGSANPIENERHITYPHFSGGFFDETAKSSYLAWQIAPHIGGGCDWNFRWGTLEPFFAIDCAVFYQPAFSEKGAEPLNMHEPSSWSELLRGELGLHAYQLWLTSVGDFALRETLSYVNQVPFGIGQIFANIVGYPPGFSVDSLTKIQNMISPAFEFIYRTPKGLFISASYMGQFQFWGQTYRSNNLFGQIGYYF